MARIAFLLTGTPVSWQDRRQFHRQAPALIAAGHEVIFVAGDPGKEELNGIRFSILPEAKRRKVFLTGGLNIFRWIKKLDPDAVQICSIGNLPLGLMLKAFTKIKVFYDCREDMYSSMLYSKVRFPKWQRRILAECTRIIQFFAAKTFDGMILSDPATFEIHKAMSPEKKVIFYNTAPLSGFGKDYPPLKERPYDITLLGGMGRRSGIYVLLGILKELAEEGRKIKTILIGSPGKADEKFIENTISELQLQDSVEITGRIPYLEVRDKLIQAKIGLVLLLDCPKFHNNIACKAFEYMACGMPVVTSDLPPERFFLEEGKHAKFFKPGDSMGAARAIITLLDDIETAQKMGENGRGAVEQKWNCEIEQEKYRQFYQKILESGNGK